MTSALMLVAHPDDELLFGGALMLARPEWDWQAMALTAGPRASKFRGAVLGFSDEWRILHRAEFDKWTQAVRDWELTPDIVVTHNRMGEYGHPHHMSVHKIAHRVFPDAEFHHFYVLAESTVGPQAVVNEPWGLDASPAKEAQFVETYGQSVLDELTADKPEMIADLFRAEWFT